MKNKDTQQLATLVYVLAMREEIEKEVESRYSKRIDYLVGENNELMRALEQSEADLKEVVEVEEEVPRMTDNGNEEEELEEELEEVISYDKEF
tara:strand:- start:203 stop:481 length:279 start_codon:yes stop_codon:yes gene_type:complete